MGSLGFSWCDLCVCPQSKHAHWGKLARVSHCRNEDFGSSQVVLQRMESPCSWLRFEVGHESKVGTGKPPALAGDLWISKRAEVTAEPSWECHSHVLSQDGQSQIPKPWILPDFTDSWFQVASGFSPPGRQHLPFLHQILLPVPPPWITCGSCNTEKQTRSTERIWPGINNFIPWLHNDNFQLVQISRDLEVSPPYTSKRSDPKWAEFLEEGENYLRGE